jgi:hypothetical protein
MMFDNDREEMPAYEANPDPASALRLRTEPNAKLRAKASGRTIAKQDW